jgi:serine/threonine protein kinase
MSGLRCSSDNLGPVEETDDCVWSSCGSDIDTLPSPITRCQGGLISRISHEIKGNDFCRFSHVKTYKNAAHNDDTTDHIEEKSQRRAVARLLSMFNAFAELSWCFTSPPSESRTRVLDEQVMDQSSSEANISELGRTSLSQSSSEKDSVKPGHSMPSKSSTPSPQLPPLENTCCDGATRIGYTVSPLPSHSHSFCHCSSKIDRLARNPLLTVHNNSHLCPERYEAHIVKRSRRRIDKRLLSGACLGGVVTMALICLLLPTMHLLSASRHGLCHSSRNATDTAMTGHIWTMNCFLHGPVAALGGRVADLFPERCRLPENYSSLWREEQCWFLLPVLYPIMSWTSTNPGARIHSTYWHFSLRPPNATVTEPQNCNTTSYKNMRGLSNSPMEEERHRGLRWWFGNENNKKANGTASSTGGARPVAQQDSLSSLLDSSFATSRRTGLNAGPSKLVIAGQMIVEESECNIAQLDLTTNAIDKDERIQLSLYNSYSGGEVYSLLANQSYIGPKKVVQNTVVIPDEDGFSGTNIVTTSPLVDTSDVVMPGAIKAVQSNRKSVPPKGSSGMSSLSSQSELQRFSLSRATSSSTGGKPLLTSVGGGSPSDASSSPPVVADDDSLPVYRYGRELIVVGAFDTTYRNSQVTYCSVGRWDGEMLNKVGEGLCNSALSKGMKITSAAFAGPNDVYVAGSFHTQVWNGDDHEFVKIFNIAHYNAIKQVWLPLQVGQLTCSWCVVTVLALAWDNKRKQLHVAGKFNAIDNRNVPAGLALYDFDSGHLVAHPGGGLSLDNITEDGVGTALQMDQENGVLYVMGSYERLTTVGSFCKGLAALEVDTNRWTCLADSKHTVEPTGGGNMLLTPYGLMVAGKVQGDQTTWPNPDKPYTIALLTINKLKRYGNVTGHEFEWSWLPGFDGHDDPIHCLSNGYGDHEGTVFIGGDNFVAKWRYKEMAVPFSEVSDSSGGSSSRNSSDTMEEMLEDTSLDGTTSSTTTGIGKGGATSTTRSSSSSNALPRDKKKMVMQKVPVTETLSSAVRGSVMAISQLVPEDESPKDEPPDQDAPGGAGGGGGGPFPASNTAIGYTILAYSLALGTVLGMLLAVLCNKNLDIVGRFFAKDSQVKGISLDTLTCSAVENSTVAEACQRAMRARFVDNPNLLTIINPAEIVVHRIIGEGTFGRVWSASWRSADVAVKEFVFAQAAVKGRSSQQRDIIDDIIGEASMMAMLRHPNVLQMFGCCLTSQAIWIVSELCSLGSLRQLLDDQDRVTPNSLKVSLALQISEGMAYLHTQKPPIIHRDLKSHNIFVHETFTHQTLNKKKKAGSYKARSGIKRRVNTSCNTQLSISADGSGNDNQDSKGNGVGEEGGGGEGAPSAGADAEGRNSMGASQSESTIVAKIGDWGTARAENAGSRTMTHGVGTACWLAPEVIKHSRCSQGSDVFAFGIILWELATQEEVYQGLETMQIIAKVANENLRPPVPPNCIWKELMVKCWHEDPVQRPSFEAIVKDLNVFLARDRLSSLSSTESMPDSYQNGSGQLLLRRDRDGAKNQ